MMSERPGRATVLIADDHTVVAEGLAVSLRPHFTVIGQVTRLDRLLETIRQSAPDVVILDLSFEGVSSLPLLQEAMADRRIESRFVVLTAYASKALMGAAFKAGALAYLLKGASTQELRLAIEAALEGQRFVLEEPGDATRILAEGVVVGGVALRPKQLQIVNYLLDGLDRDAIAEAIGISAKGVDYHLGTTREVTGTPNIRLLMLWAAEHEAALRLALKKGKDDADRLVPKRRR